MPVTLGITTPKAILGQAVYTKEAWGDAWTAQTNMFCTSATWATGPAISTADLYYRYGRGAVAGSGTIATVSPFTLPSFCYVRVEFDAWDSGGSETPVYWYGVMGSTVDQRGGSAVSSAPQGVQSFQALGLEWLLERTIVTTSKFVSDSTLRTANRGFTFNQTKNRSSATQAGTFISSYVFESTGGDWSTSDIVKYLLAFHAPKNVSGTQTQDWQLSDPAGVLPINDAPLLPADHLPVWHLLNQLISRQRGMGFQIYVSGSQIILLPHSFAQTSVALPSGDTLPANANQIDLVLTGDRCVYSKTTDRQNRCTQVKVIGARAVHCFSADYSNSGFAANWSAADEVGYRAGGSNHPDYPQASEVSEQERFTFLARELPNYPSVYRKFGVPGLATAQALAWGPRRLFHDDMVIEQNIPLHEGFDYVSGSSPTYDRTVPYREPFIVFETPRAQQQFNPFYVLGNRNRALQTNEGASLEYNNHHFTVTVESIRSYTGLHIEPAAFHVGVHGAPRHAIDGPNWTDVTKPLPIDIPVGAFDYQKALITVAAEWDYYCEYSYPTSPSASEVAMLKVIEAGPEFQLHYLAANTIVGVDGNGELLLSGSARYIRDDRAKLQELATLAYQWYGSDRTAVKLQTQHFTNQLDRGQMWATVDSATTNTVVTSITLNANVGTEAKQPVAIFETSYAEFDVIQAHKARRLK